jgi:hypothetical protein
MRALRGVLMPLLVAPESVLVAYDKKSQELFMVQPLEELEDDLELRISLLNRYALSSPCILTPLISAERRPCP